MPFSQGSRSGLAYTVETQFGVTPASPQLKSLPINTSSLSLTKTAIESAEIRSDRQIKFMRHGNRQVGGTVDVDFRAGDFDDLIQSAFFGRFSGGILKNGIQPLSMSIEDRSLDIGQYRLFKGCMVNNMSVSIRPDAIVTASFGLIGKGISTGISSADDDITDTSANQPFVSFEASLTEGGQQQAVITGLDFSIDNGINPTYVIGSAETPQLEYGRSTVTGTITAYYENQVLLNKFVNETESSLAIAMSDGTNVYTFQFPRIKYSGGEVSVQSEQSRTINLPFTALLDPVQKASILLTSTLASSSSGNTSGQPTPGFLLLSAFS